MRERVTRNRLWRSRSTRPTQETGGSVDCCRLRRPLARTTGLPGVQNESVIRPRRGPGVPPVRLCNLCKVLADNYPSHAGPQRLCPYSGLRSAWVPGVRAGISRWGDRIFSSDSILACRSSVTPLYPVAGRTSRGNGAGSIPLFLVVSVDGAGRRTSARRPVPRRLRRRRWPLRSPAATTAVAPGGGSGSRKSVPANLFRPPPSATSDPD